MKIGSMATVEYIYNERKSEKRTGTIGYISPFGWIAIKFSAGWVECFWREKVRV